MACLKYVPKEPIGFAKAYMEFAKKVYRLEDGRFLDLETKTIYESLEDAEHKILKGLVKKYVRN